MKLEIISVVNSYYEIVNNRRELTTKNDFLMKPTDTT